MDFKSAGMRLAPVPVNRADLLALCRAVLLGDDKDAELRARQFIDETGKAVQASDCLPPGPAQADLKLLALMRLLRAVTDLLEVEVAEDALHKSRCLAVGDPDNDDFLLNIGKLRAVYDALRDALEVLS